MTGSVPIDPATILAVVPKPGGREAVLLRRVGQGELARLEITLAQGLPSGTYHAVRSIGISPAILGAFETALPYALGRLRSGKGR